MTTQAEKLHELIDTVIVLHGRIDSLEERMKTYEKQATENTAILRRVETTVNAVDKFFAFLRTFLKWCGTVIGLIVASVAATWIIHVLLTR